jgi:hypothetical protein
VGACSTGRFQDGAVVANATRSVGIWKKDGAVHREKYGNSVDAFAIYCPKINKCYLVPATEIQGIEIRLRVEATKNNQQKNVSWARDFELK